MTDRIFSSEQLDSIARILMGAVTADGHIDDDERATIAAILDRLAPGGSAAPGGSGLDSFDPKRFDLETTCRSLPRDTPEARRAILDLVVEITNADDAHTSDEDRYIRTVASHLGASDEEIAGLVVDFDDIFSDDDDGDFFS